VFEFAITFIVFLIVFYSGSYWLSLFSTLILLILVLPGLYAMFRGAPYVPSSDKKIKAIMKLGDFGEKDVVYDLGCGDGRVIREVAGRGVKRATGYELSIPTYFLARLRRHFASSEEKIYFGNFWKQDFSDADVLVCFLLDKSMIEVGERIWPKLKKGARVVSNIFKMGDLKPDLVKDGVYLYVKK